MADPKGISFGEGIPPQTRSADFAMVQAPARDGRPLGFRLALPSDWKEVPSPPPGQNDEMSVAATFAASNDVNVIVMQTRIPFEINLADWLEYQCHLRKFKIDRLQSEHAQNGTEVHAVAYTADGDLLRMVAVGDGDRVLWLIGRTIATLAVEYEETLGLAAASIRILSYSGKDTREPLNTYQDAASGIRLLYPASWQPESLKPGMPNKSATDFRLMEGRETMAYLRVEVNFTLGPGKARVEAVASYVRCRDRRIRHQGPPARADPHSGCGRYGTTLAWLVRSSGWSWPGCDALQARSTMLAGRDPDLTG